MPSFSSKSTVLESLPKQVALQRRRKKGKKKRRGSFVIDHPEYRSAKDRVEVE
jgi:hypothetical protein